MMILVLFFAINENPMYLINLMPRSIVSGILRKGFINRTRVLFIYIILKMKVAHIVHINVLLKIDNLYAR